MKNKKEIPEEIRIQIEKDFIKFMNSPEKKKIDKKLKHIKLDSQHEKFLKDLFFELDLTIMEIQKSNL